MKKPKIPRFYKEEELIIYGEKVKISSYRVIDNEYALPFIKKQIELEEYQKNNKKQSGEKAAEMVAEMEELAYPLAQRGLKRYYYPNIMKTNELDQTEDIDMDPKTALKVAATMIGLGLMGDDETEKKQKVVKSDRKKSSKTSKME
jgi:hypothetical protein